MLARTAFIIFAAGLFLVSAEGDFVSQAHGDETRAIREELNRLENADPGLRTASLNVYVTLRAQKRGLGHARQHARRLGPNGSRRISQQRCDMLDLFSPRELLQTCDGDGANLRIRV